ncbi:hypothetical protein ACFVWG_11265 [Kribbella sp. NPDC058245]|uniref:hypothetical protein n=1 Tax=Kribbella sp. NPDC058245 TaxID=3346399 RepID=UPI0036EC0797
MRLHAGRTVIALVGAITSALLVSSGAGAATATFSPQSIVWPTQSDGYVLGRVTCSTTTCPAAVKATHDGGKTWAAVGRTHNGLAMSGERGLTSLQFATKTFGWAYDPFLEATRDGGKTWTQVPIPGGDAKVLNLLAAQDGTYVVTSGCAIGSGICDDRPLKVWRAPAGQLTGWKQVKVDVAAGDHAALASSGATVYLLAAPFVDQSRLSTISGGVVKPVSTVTCPTQEDGFATDLAANAPNRIFILCNANFGRGHSDKSVMVSADGGRTFRYDAVTGGLGLGSQLAVGADGAVLLTTVTASLVYNRPAFAKSWQVADNWLENSEHIHDLVWQSATTAWMVERDAAYTPDTRLWMTRDAGQTWQQTTIPA